MNSYFNTDFKTGIDWSTVGDYSSAFDNINSEAFGKLNNASSSLSGEDKWKKAVSKGIGWLSGTGKDKYRLQAERQQGGVGFMPRSDGGGGGGQFQPVASDISVWMPPQDQAFTVQAPQSGGGGLGSTIGGLVGMGGTALGVFGPLGYAAGRLAGKAADEIGLFG